MKQYSISELSQREKIALKDILNIDWSKNIMITNPLSGNPIKDFGSSLELAQDLFKITGSGTYSPDISLNIAEYIVAAIIQYIMTHKTVKYHNLAFVITLACHIDYKKTIFLLRQYKETEGYAQILDSDPILYSNISYIILSLIGRLFTKEYIYLFLQESYTPDFIDDEMLNEGYTEIPQVVQSWI